VRLPNNQAFNLSAQALLYRDLLSICVHESACTLFQTWGFTDRHSWVPETFRGSGWALPFDVDYEKKRAYTAMLKKLNGRGNRGPRPR
jgi:endo-1,4-beta-xylanase